MRALGKAMRNMRRTPYQSMAAILVLTITFFVAYLIGFITLSLTQALVYFESRPQVLVFFETSTPEFDIIALKEQLESNQMVTDVTYVPQDEALNIYRELNKNDPLLLELVTADILPASLEISAVSLEALQLLKSETEVVVGVEEVVLRSDVVDTLSKWLMGVRYAGGTFIGVMMFTSILIIVVVVGMKIAGRNFEIRVMRLMGASGWYIQAPYLAEGALYGILAANFAFALALSVVLYTSPIILDFAGEVPLIPESYLYVGAIYCIAVISGWFIGMFGSYIAVKRYLKL